MRSSPRDRQRRFSRLVAGGGPPGWRSPVHRQPLGIALLSCQIVTRLDITVSAPPQIQECPLEVTLFHRQPQFGIRRACWSRWSPAPRSGRPAPAEGRETGIHRSRQQCQMNTVTPWKPRDAFLPARRMQHDPQSDPKQRARQAAAVSSHRIKRQPLFRIAGDTCRADGRRLFAGRRAMPWTTVNRSPCRAQSAAANAPPWSSSLPDDRRGSSPLQYRLRRRKGLAWSALSASVS